MQTEQDIQRALGRYRASWLFLALPTVTAVVILSSSVLAMANGRADGGSYARAGIAALLLLVVWGLPATVITTTGFRRGFRFTSWAEVAAVFPAGPGDPDLLIGLRNGKKVSLVGVGQERGPGIIALAGRASLEPTD